MKFWKIFGASMAAVTIGIVVILFVLASFGSKFSSMFDLKVDMPKVEQQTVLYIDLSEDIVDAPRTSLFSNFDITTATYTQPITLMQALMAIEGAAIDPNIKGICIRQNGYGRLASTSYEELRGAIERFKLSGKFVVAYDEAYTQAEYYLASVAECVFLHPKGTLDWRGVGFNITFFKSLIDKIEAKVEVFRPEACKYKSAVEPFTLTKSSKYSSEQLLGVAQSMWSTIVAQVGKSRNIDADTLKRYAQNLEVYLAGDAAKCGMVDGLIYEDELEEYYMLHGVEPNDDGSINTISLGTYILCQAANVAKGGSNTSDIPLIAIIYADGNIVDGNMVVDDYVYSSTICSQLREARLNDNIKAVIVRVNSPGGSALAADVIYREMTLLQQTKPVVVSMGSSAASGGYYISAPADYIIANNTTLTGSIGVFGIIFNIENTLKNLLGITIDNVGTSATAAGISLVQPLQPRQREILKKEVNLTYNTFLRRVADGRNLKVEDVAKVAEGRVWSGAQAVENGLVDFVGGLSEALNIALNLADLRDNFSLYEILPPPTPLEQFIESMGLNFVQSCNIDYDTDMATIQEFVLNNRFLVNNGGIQAVMPIDVKVNL